jgi:hypothetical protein
MMVSMAALQVFVVRFFFQGARKGTFPPSLYILWDRAWDLGSGF